MAGNTDGQVVIKVDLSSNDAEKELSRLKKKFLSLEEDLTVGKHKKTALENKLENINEKLGELNKKEIRLGGSGLTGSEVETMNRLAKESESVVLALDRQERALEDTQTTLEGVKLRYEEVKALAEQVAAAETTTPEQGADADVEVEQVNRGLTRTQAVFRHIKEQIKSSFDFSHAKEGIKGVLSAIGSIIKKLAKVSAKGILGTAKKGISGILTGLKSCASNIGTIFTRSKSVSKSFGGIGSAVKRIAPALLAAEGVIGILRKAVNAYMQQNQQLANTLSGAWTGLGNILGPVIDRMVSLLANAIAYFTKFINLLGFTGKTASKQISNAGGTAKKESDELKKQLMSFDELNILQDNESDSGGGGGGGSDAGITPNVQLPDWAQLMAQQLRSAQWSEAATTLTTALNNMVDSVDWGGIGSKIGFWLNGAMEFLATSINTFDWQRLGGSLAAAVNNLISSVDWSNLGTILAGNFKIVLSTLAGFILNLDMVELANAASNIIIGFFNSITDTITNTDWHAIGEQIKTFLVNVDWIGIAESVAEAAGAALGAFVALFWDSLKEAWGNLIDWWNEVAYEDGQFTIEGLLNGIGDALANIGTWIDDHIFKPFIDGFKKAFGIHSPSKIMAEQGGYIIDGLLNGITAAWQRVKDWFSEALSNIKQAFSDAWASIRDTASNIWNGIVDTIKGAINGVIGVINRMLATVTDGVNGLMRLLSFSIDIPGIGSVGLSLPQFTAPQIPYLAQGAVIPPNAPFAAVLGDQRHGNNIEAPEDLIRKIVREEAAGGASNDEIVSLLRELIEVVMGIKIGDETIGKAALRYTRRYNRAMGV